MSYWPISADDRPDRFWAMGVSTALHATLLLFYLSEFSNSSLGEPGDAGNSTSLSARFVETTEFRQPLVLASPSKPSDESPSLAAANFESASEKHDNLPLPVTSAPGQPASLNELAGDAEAQGAGARPTPQASEALGSEGSSMASGTSAGAHAEDDKRAAYLAALKAAIQSKWTRNPTSHGTCFIKVFQTISGNVTSVMVENCELDDADRMALETATLRAQPLPYAGYESVFAAQVVLELSR